MRVFTPWLLSMLMVSPAFSAENTPGKNLPVRLTTLSDRVRVEIAGELFTEYIFKDVRRPCLYPVLMPDGTSLVRDFPMKKTPGEEHDHPAHRSLWFAHPMNGVDFWNEPKTGLNLPKGAVVHDDFLETASGEVGLIRVRDRWLSQQEKMICTTETAIRLSGTSDMRMIDYDITIYAQAEEPLVILDTKEGTMAMRLAQWMTMPHSYMNKKVAGEGHYVTSTGLRDEAVWGKRAAWCDAYAPRGGKVYGVAIFDHPQNPRHPTWWMARDYGLFAANPFGQHDFENLRDPHAGNYTIPAGGKLTLRYRFVFHYGDDQAAKIADLYRDYASEN